MPKTLAKWLPLVLLALYLPAMAVWNSGGYTRLSAQRYRSLSNLRGDKISHQRWLYEAARNLRARRLGSLSVVDEKQPINSSPQFQYYSVGVYTVLAPLVVLFDDLELAYLIGLLLFSAALTAGAYLWTRRLSGSHATAAVLTGVVMTNPFLATAALDLYQFTGLAALALFALGTYLWLVFLLSERRGPRDFALLLTVVALGSLFLLAHNLTVALFALFVAPLLALQLRRETRGRAIPASRWLAVPIAVTAATLFYWIPILRDQARLVIATGGDTVLNAMFERFPLGELVFSPVSSSPAASLVPMYPQVGWATLVAGALLFTPRNWLAYLIEGLLLCLATVNVWAWVPAPLHAVQFPFRVLICVPFLLLFQARALRPWQNGALALLTVGFALVNLTRAPIGERLVDHGSFPAFFYSQFYRTDAPPDAMPSLGETPALTTRQGVTVDTLLSETGTLAWAQALAAVEKAVTYRITLAGDGASDSVLGALLLSYPDGEVRQVGQYEFRTDRPAYISACSPGASKAKLYLQSGSGRRMPPARFHLERIADDTYRYVHSARGWHAVLCDYAWNAREQEWVFHVPPGGPAHQILPIYSSPDNRLDARPASGGYLHWTTLGAAPFGVENSPVESFSVFAVRPEGGAHALRLNAGNRLKWLVPATFLALMAFALASLAGARSRRLPCPGR